MKINKHEQSRLAALITRQGTICFCRGYPDTVIPTVRWSVFGIPITNEVVVKADNGRVSYYHSEVSPLLYPPMADRIFGIDVCDDALAKKLGCELWAEAGTCLSMSVGAPSQNNPISDP